MTHKTNTQVVSELMRFSRYGALAEAFVVDAITKAAESAAAITDEQCAGMQNSLIHPVAWRDVGLEIKAKLDAAYRPERKAA